MMEQAESFCEFELRLTLQNLFNAVVSCGLKENTLAGLASAMNGYPIFAIGVEGFRMVRGTVRCG